MKFRYVLITISALALSMALAQGDYSDNSGGGNSATQTQEITITIPQRVALHLTESSYTLDLNSPPAYAPEHLRNGEGCRLLRKSEAAIVAASIIPVGYLDPVGLVQGYIPFEGLVLEPTLTLELLALNNPVVNTYPAVVLDINDDVVNDGSEYLKGTLVCFNRKIVQKFSNAGWTFSANVTMDAGVGKFGIIDRVPAGLPHVDGDPEGDVRHLISTSTNNLTLAYSSVPTGGWLDDHITELFWFDGTETPGANKQITVEYILTGNF